MNTIELIIVGIGLAMDAFAVSVCKGLSLHKFEMKFALITGGYFGFFQGLMPLIGYFAGSAFSHIVSTVDHWIVFILLAIIGGKMIHESFEDNQDTDPSFAFKIMLSLAIATSIDALAVGVSFAFLNVNIWIAATIIAITTFVISFAGVAIGNIFGSKFKSKAEFAGGLVLILMGLKILLEHLGIF